MNQGRAGRIRLPAFWTCRRHPTEPLPRSRVRLKIGCRLCKREWRARRGPTEAQRRRAFEAFPSEIVREPLDGHWWAEDIIAGRKVDDVAARHLLRVRPMTFDKLIERGQISVPPKRRKTDRYFVKADERTPPGESEYHTIKHVKMRGGYMEYDTYWARQWDKEALFQANEVLGKLVFKRRELRRLEPPPTRWY